MSKAGRCALTAVGGVVGWWVFDNDFSMLAALLKVALRLIA